MRKHRIKINDLRRHTIPSAQDINGIGADQVHLCGSRSDHRIRQRTPQAVLKQCGNQGVTLDQGHRATQPGQHEGIAPQPGSSIQNDRTNPRLNAHCFGNRLPVAATEQPPVCHRSGDKVHPDRPRRVRAQLDQLQAVAPDLQGKRCLAVELQPEPLCIGCRQKIKRGV